jgi:hypothetical protein
MLVQFVMILFNKSDFTGRKPQYTAHLRKLERMCSCLKYTDPVLAVNILVSFVFH